MVICRESPIFATKSTHNMKRSFYFIPVWAVMAFAFLSCGEDRTYEFLAKTEVDNWIEAQMREIYLYYREIPQLETEDYFSPAEEFFPKLLASQDKYSYIEVPTETDAATGIKLRNAIQTVTYGFDFVLTDDPTGSSRQVARVLQVLPNLRLPQSDCNGATLSQKSTETMSAVKIPAFWKTGMERYSRFPPFRPTRRPVNWFGTMKRQNLHFRLPSTWRTTPSSFTRSSSRTEGKPVIWYIMNSRQA